MTTQSAQRPVSGIHAGESGTEAAQAMPPTRLFDRGDGTFLKPAPPATAEHCIGFWSSIDVPDVVIDQFHEAYAVFRNEEITARLESEMTVWAQNWKRENTPPRRPGRELEKHQARYVEEFNAYQDSIRDRVYQERPNQIGQYDARQLVRAAQMLRHRPHPAKFPEESDKVLRHEVELFDETLTVHQIELRYQLSSISHAMKSIFPPKPSAELREVLDFLGRINENIVINRQEMGY